MVIYNSFSFVAMTGIYGNIPVLMRVCYTIGQFYCLIKWGMRHLKNRAQKNPRRGYISKMLQQLPIGGQVDVLFLQRFDQKLVIPTGRGQDVAPDDEILRHLRRLFL